MGEWMGWEGIGDSACHSISTPKILNITLHLCFVKGDCYNNPPLQNKIERHTQLILLPWMKAVNIEFFILWVEQKSRRHHKTCWNEERMSSCLVFLINSPAFTIESHENGTFHSTGIVLFISSWIALGWIWFLNSGSIPLNIKNQKLRGPCL